MTHQVRDQTAFLQSFDDPVRATAPYVPTESVSTQVGGIPIVGVLVLAAIVLFFEWRRIGGRRR